MQEWELPEEKRISFSSCGIPPKTEAEIRAMPPGDELDWEADKFYESVHEETVGGVPVLLTKHGMRNKSGGSPFIDPQFQVSRNEAAAMAMLKALAEWWTKLPVTEAILKSYSTATPICRLWSWNNEHAAELGYFTGDPIENWSVIYSRHQKSPEHAIAILAALAHLYRTEKGV